MRFLRRENKSSEDLKDKIEHKTESNKAYRLSLEMRQLAYNLIRKAEQLEKELANGGRRS